MTHIQKTRERQLSWPWLPANLQKELEKEGKAPLSKYNKKQW